MKNTILFLIGLFSFFISKTNAQELNANFTSAQTKGCFPLTVVFTNLSSPTNGLTYSWDFGNGSTSNALNPIVLFTEAGSFEVKLIISNGINTGTIIKSNYIRVFQKPIPSFNTSSEKIGCAPFEVEFINQTLLGDTSISLWHWDFGDGYISGSQNPTHVFQYQDTCSISLYVKDKNNCSNFIVYDDYIAAFKPVSSFGLSDSVTCNGLLQTRFVNNSIGIGLLKYIWDFGDGTSSDQQNPEKTYNLHGVYDVGLITFDEHTCSDTLVKKELVTIEELKAEFTLNKDTFCINENLAFTNTSSKTQKSHWDFGDGTSSDLINPSHRYATAGNYTIILTVKIDKGCFDIYSHQINVEKVIADYTSSRTFGCDSDVIVNYLDNSTNAAQWDWRFGNKMISNLKNPTISYTKEGIYMDTLIITSKHGCKSMKVVNPSLILVRPQAIFTPNNWVDVNDLKGCTPLTVNFKDKSIYATNQDSVISWFWDFGDGGTSTAKNPSHQFQGTTTYQVNLKLTTAKGCIANYGATAKTGTKQAASFVKAGPDVICASTAVQFTDKSENKDLINEWYWKFGDGKTSSKQNPSHLFVDSGYMEVELLVYYNGCPANEIKTNFIYVNGPIVNPEYTTTCSNPLFASFKSNTILADKIYWDFGDCSPIDSLHANPDHLYNLQGDYKAVLKAVNKSKNCVYETQKVVLVRNITAAIEVDKAVGCPGATISFNPSISIDEYNFQNNGSTAKYLWNFDDGTKIFNSTVPFSHQFNSKGIYNVKLKVKDFRGCEDSIIQQIKIFKPAPDFMAENFIGCMPMSVDFENKSISDTVVAQWLWDFGDNTISNEKDPNHIYAKYGLYNVSLTVTDKLGCNTQISKSDFIQALKPSPDFTVTDRTICTGDTIAFTSLATDSIRSYLWNFGDGTSSSSPKPYHVYSNSGAFNVSLKLTDVQGCDSLKTMPNFIDIQKPPDADFEVDETFANCFPLAINFTDKSQGININKWDWNFEEKQSSAHIQNPIHTFTQPGVYDITLKATTSYGCANTMFKENLIEIKGPWISINAPETICKNSPVKLYAEDKMNVFDMQWFFNDGTVGFGDTVYHAYKNAGIITPAILLMSDDLHTCDKYFVDTMYMDELKASIYESENSQSGCVPFTKTFTDQSVGAKSWSWSFGDGNVSNIQNPVYLYQTDGRFKTSLITSNSFGCTDTAFSDIRVFPLPNIKLTKDTLVCRGQSIRLMASGAMDYTWFPGDYLNSDFVSMPLSTPEKTIDYEVMGIDSNSCVNYSTMNLAVQQIPVVNIPDTTIIIGEVVRLNAYASDLLSYCWNPFYGLSNKDSANITAQPLESTIYEVTVVDTNKCFVVTKEVSIQIRKEYTVDVPAAFTPNGDGINDKIFVKGWGVKDIIDFKVFNRFGELVFESHDKKDGWDGIYKGNNQNIETYTYYVKVRTYEDEILDKTGTIKLLK